MPGTTTEAILLHQLRNTLQHSVPLTSDDWNCIQERFAYCEVQKGEYLVQQGVTCNYISFVGEGFLRTYTLNQDGNEITTHFAYAGTFVFSFFSFLNRVPSFENIQALEHTQLLQISYPDLRWLQAHLPKWQQLYSMMMEEAYACMEQRNYMLQNFTASQKYEALILNAHPSILQKATLGHISSYLGIKPETLSRIRKKAVK